VINTLFIHTCIHIYVDMCIYSNATKSKEVNGNARQAEIEAREIGKTKSNSASSTMLSGHIAMELCFQT